MREQTKTVFVAFDGSSFDTAAECRAYERDNIHLALVGLTVENIEAALSRDDLPLGDAIEAVAYRIRQTRVAAGDMKRERRKTAEPEPAAEPAAAAEPGTPIPNSIAQEPDDTPDPAEPVSESEMADRLVGPGRPDEERDETRAPSDRANGGDSEQALFD